MVQPEHVETQQAPSASCLRIQKVAFGRPRGATDVVFGDAQVKEAALQLGYQPDETFCLKISQLREIFVVRWSVFLLGPAGCGKSAVWKTLLRATLNNGEKIVFKPINPKVCTDCHHLHHAP